MTQDLERTAEPPLRTGSPPDDAVFQLDRSWRLTYVNPAARELIDYVPGDVIGRDVREALPDLRGTVLEDGLAAVFAGGRARSFEYLHRHRQRWLEIRVSPDPSGVLAVIRDVDDRRRASDSQQAELDRLAAALESLPSATVLLDETGRIVLANRRWTSRRDMMRSVGIEPGEVGQSYLEAMSQLLAHDDRAAIAEGLRGLIADPGDGEPGVFDYEYSARLGAGTGWFRLQASRVASSSTIVVSHVNVTEQVESERALAWAATHDDLTGLPNRAAMLQLIDEALDGASVERRGTALLSVDLDGFKTVNDSLGHDVGDALIREAGKRLVEQVRPGDAVGRLGGDQFLILARGCDSAEAAALAFRLQGIFATPFPAEGLSVPLSASIGVAVGRPECSDAHSLLGDADAAMYAAKAAGRDRVHLFSPGLREAARWRMDVATRLRDGAVDQLVVHYQPVVRLDTGEVEGVEALVRWRHPERGLLLPDAFLSVAEETGQLIPITRWLLCETTRQAAAWAAEGLRLRLAVNISARHFSAETLVRDVRTALRQSGLPPEQLMLELTETSLAEDPTRAEDQLTVLRGLGVRVAIDDFGTGWSSMAQLLSLPIGILKIDRSLLTAAERAAGENSVAILGAIVALTRTLGIRSVAEGVETARHLRLVREAGCDLAQGWLLAQPMPAGEVGGWIRRVQADGGDLCRQVVQRGAR